MVQTENKSIKCDLNPLYHSVKSLREKKETDFVVVVAVVYHKL